MQRERQPFPLYVYVADIGPVSDGQIVRLPNHRHSLIVGPVNLNYCGGHGRASVYRVGDIIIGTVVCQRSGCTKKWSSHPSPSQDNLF